MNIEQKAALYDDLVRKGQELHRKLYNLQMKLDNTQEEKEEMKKLGRQIGNVQLQMEKLMGNA